MERRQVLAFVPVLLAGCTGGSGGSGPSTTDESTTSTDESTSTTPERPTLESTDFRLTDTGCASEDAEEATVAFDGSTVTVTGAIVGANGCYAARFADARYDADADEFTVLVESYDASDDDEMCTQCITAVEYEVTAEFDGGLPGTVVVKHGGYEATHTVATASP